MANKKTKKKTDKSFKTGVKTTVKKSIKTRPKASEKAKQASPKTSSKKASLKAKTITSKTKKAIIKKPPTKKTAAKKVFLKNPSKTKLPHPLVKKPAEEKSIGDKMTELRRVLVRKREEIVKAVKSEVSKYIKGETRQLVDTALDDGDWSVIDLSEDINLRHLGAHRENLLKMDEALRKLEEGTYGICEDCGEPIAPERLKILPFAIYCIDCQERREQLEAMERKEGIG
jgi:DnaK suppressor protein